MTTDTVRALVLILGEIVLVLIVCAIYQILAWLDEDKAYRRRRRNRRQITRLAARGVFTRPPANPLVRVVNGRPVMPEPVPVPMFVRVAAQQRWMDWTPPEIWEQPLLPIRGIVAFEDVR